MILSNSTSSTESHGQKALSLDVVLLPNIIVHLYSSFNDKL